MPDDARHVPEVRLVGLPQVLQQGAGRAHGQVPPLDAEPGQGGRPEDFLNDAPRGPGRQREARHGPGQHAVQVLSGKEILQGPVLGVQDLARPEQGHLRRQGITGRRTAVLREPEVAGGQVEIGAAEPVPRAGAPGMSRRLDGGDVVRLGGGELRGIGDRPRGDDAGHGPSDDPFCGARVLHLVADGDPVPLPDETRHVRPGGMERHAAHRRLVLRAAAARSQGQ